MMLTKHTAGLVKFMVTLSSIKKTRVLPPESFLFATNLPTCSLNGDDIKHQWCFDLFANFRNIYPDYSKHELQRHPKYIMISGIFFPGAFHSVDTILLVFKRAFPFPLDTYFLLTQWAFRILSALMLHVLYTNQSH